MNVFVYGTLTEPDRVGEVVSSYVFVGPAVLRGMHAVEGRYPTLAPGGEVAGRLLRTAEIDALDAYEGVDRGLYVRVTVPSDEDSDGEGDETAVYVGDPDLLEVRETVEWPGDGPLRDRVVEFVRRNEVCIEPID